ncbi:MAG TPA: response regulator [Bacteroidetes bacterium]|nr:response regulator [Bacteroidota bacterium]
MNLKILVVDDEPDVALIFRQKFRKRLREGEISFVFAANGREALDELKADPEIVILFTDINMPVMNGLTLLREIRELELKLLVPLIISAYDDMRNIREAMNQGAYDFVTKPIEVDELDRVLNKAIGEVEKLQTGIEAVRRLEEAERQKELAEYSKGLQRDFFDNITHEIRTPLTLLLGPLESALGITTEEVVHGFLTQARRNGHLLLDLVNQLLDFARLDAAEMVLNLQPVDMVQIAEDLRMIFAPLAAEKQLEFVLLAEEGSLPWQADPQKLLRILLNLLSNAFKFTPQGGVVRLQVKQEADEIVFEVQDSGPGIPEAQQAHIFERFYRTDTSEKSACCGTGIGLALSRALAELHGGKITLHSRVGAGATFSLRLPQQIGKNLTSIDAAAETVPVSLPITAESSPPPISATLAEDDQRPLLLLVEDNAEMRAYIEAFLRPKFRLSHAANGLIGLESAWDLVPDLIITDWMMPEMDGIEMLEILRHDRSTSHIPVVMLTAKAQVDARVEGLRTGADAYLSKPFHAAELIAQINSLFQQRARMRERFKQEFLRPEKVKGTSIEDQFISDVKRLMEVNLGNEKFSVELMADELAMSRRTLGRKLSALTGEAPVRFIRNYRLERGRQMLTQKAAPVWEVALKTGFGSSSYFTKCFKDHYGISPREAVDQDSA